MTPDVRSTLAAAADGNVPVHLIALSHELRAKGHFTTLSDGGVGIALDVDHPLAPLLTVSVSFSLGMRTWSFVASVLEAKDTSVVVSAPDEMLWADRRLTPRIPISENVIVELPGLPPECAPRVVDLALAGMKVTVAAPAPLHVGDRLPIVLEFQGHRVEVIAELRRIEGDGLGFFFPDSVRAGRISPPPALAALLEKVR